MVSLDRTHYKRNFLISLILSETIIIFAFLLFPEFRNERIETIINESFFLGEVTPPTRHLKPTLKPPPKVPVQTISDEIDAFDLLDDVNLLNAVFAENESMELSKESIKTRLQNEIPRLVLEVLPENKDKLLVGRINFSLRINEEGMVTLHKILFNSLDCDNCIETVISAVYKSKWEPALQNGAKIESWVKKSYVFN